MKQATRTLLNELNARFYAQHAQDFSATRRRPWPGLARALASAPMLDGPASGSVLDVGCGNGRALPVLQARYGSALCYRGVDASEPLLAIARARWQSERVGNHELEFERADFTALPADQVLPAGRFELVLLLGVLHCVPSQQARLELLAAAGTRVALGGTLVVTIWRYDSDPRFSARRVAVERYAELASGLVASELEPGDALLTFGPDPQAVRYAHFPGEAELTELSASPGLPLRARFHADGAGQQLNEYLVFAAPGTSSD